MNHRFTLLPGKIYLFCLKYLPGFHLLLIDRVWRQPDQKRKKSCDPLLLRISELRSFTEKSNYFHLTVVIDLYESVTYLIYIPEFSWFFFPGMQGSASCSKPVTSL